MKKAWQIIISIVLIVVLLGAVFIGVGLITGADSERIMSVLDSRYNLSEWIDYVVEVWNVVWMNLTDSPEAADALVMSAG